MVAVALEGITRARRTILGPAWRSIVVASTVVLVAVGLLVAFLLLRPSPAESGPREVRDVDASADVNTFTTFGVDTPFDIPFRTVVLGGVEPATTVARTAVSNPRLRAGAGTSIGTGSNVDTSTGAGTGGGGGGSTGGGTDPTPTTGGPAVQPTPPTQPGPTTTTTAPPPAPPTREPEPIVQAPDPTPVVVGPVAGTGIVVDDTSTTVTVGPVASAGVSTEDGVSLDAPLLGISLG